MGENQNSSEQQVLVVLEVSCLTGIRTPTLTESVQELQLKIRDGDTVRIGRSSSNDLVLVNPDVSRFHATIQASREAVILSDLSSSNGTFVNGKMISAPVRLLSDDSITMGCAQIKVQLLTAPSDETMRASSTHLAQMSSVDMTVLLVDICSYTKISQALPPEDVTNMLRCWFESSNPIIAECGGVVDKYIGDCIMAIWRDRSGEKRTSAHWAAKAALKIIEETKRIASNGAWPHEAKFPWRCRAALHTGSALMGGLAGGAKHFTVLGDAVNVAFRIESYANKLGSELVLSSATGELLKDHFRLKNLGQFQLEGRTGEEAIYTIIAPNSAERDDLETG